jgi:hypothetical protein
VSAKSETSKDISAEGLDGLLHFLLSPEDVIPALALSLFAGLRGAMYGRRALFVLPACWLLGGFTDWRQRRAGVLR